MSESKNTFDYIKLINGKSGIPDLLDGYEAFLANKNFSNTADSILYANEVNKSGIDAEMNFDFYYYGLSKNSRRYGKWYKKPKEKADKNLVLNIIIELYACSMKHAQELYDILERNNTLDDFAAHTEKGGRIK